MIFESIHPFKDWAASHASESLQMIYQKLSDADFEALLAQFNKHGHPVKANDMMALTQQLGKSIGGFLLMAKDGDTISEGAETKAFVVENTILLFQCIQGGSSQTTDTTATPNMANLFPGGMIDGFVRPMAERGYEESLKMMKRMRDI